MYGLFLSLSIPRHISRGSRVGYKGALRYLADDGQSAVVAAEAPGKWIVPASIEKNDVEPVVGVVHLR